jgi:hypothetical protein
MPASHPQPTDTSHRYHHHSSRYPHHNPLPDPPQTAHVLQTPVTPTPSTPSSRFLSPIQEARILSWRGHTTPTSPEASVGKASKSAPATLDHDPSCNITVSGKSSSQHSRKGSSGGVSHTHSKCSCASRVQNHGPHHQSVDQHHRPKPPHHRHGHTHTHVPGQSRVPEHRPQPQPEHMRIRSYYSSRKKSGAGSSSQATSPTPVSPPPMTMSMGLSTANGQNQGQERNLQHSPEQYPGPAHGYDAQPPPSQQQYQPGPQMHQQMQPQYQPQSQPQIPPPVHAPPPRIAGARDPISQA